MLFTSACVTSDEYLTEQEALDAAWNALEPNTASHDQSNWHATAELVDGQGVAGRFESEPAPGCLGPTPSPNKQFSSGKYWYVILEPVPVTPRPGTPSPTAPPLIPEPFTRQAQFLLDATEGTVVARKLSCVIY